MSPENNQASMSYNLQVDDRQHTWYHKPPGVTLCTTFERDLPNDLQSSTDDKQEWQEHGTHRIINSVDCNNFPEQKLAIHY